MTDYLRRFWLLFVSLAGVGGLYVGALSVNLVPIFWLVLALALILAALGKFYQPAKERLSRIRKFPIALRRIAELEDEVARLQDKLQETVEQAELSWRKGVLEGESRVLGTVNALSAGAPPTIIGVTRRAGAVAIVARYNESQSYPKGACRYALVDSAVGDYIGSVETFDRDEQKKLAFLKCAIVGDAAFWRDLDKRVDGDRSPPRGLELQHQGVAGAGFGIETSEMAPEADR